MELTTKLIENARYDGRSYVGKGGRKTWSKHLIRDEAVAGLGVRVFPTGRKTFVLSYQDEGKKRTKTLGEFGALTLAAAREKGKELLESVGAGSPPSNGSSANSGQRLSTVADLTQAYLDQQFKDRGNAAFAQQRLIRLRIDPVLGRVPLSEVRSGELWRLRTQLTKRYPTDSGRLSNLLLVVFKWAASQGLLEGELDTGISESDDEAADISGGDEDGNTTAFSAEEIKSEEIVSQEVGESVILDNAADSQPVVSALEGETDGEGVAFASFDELQAAYRDTKAELVRTKHELDGVKRYAGNEEQTLIEKLESTEKRADTLSLSVQQLQDTLRETEDRLERSTRKLAMAEEKEQSLTWEISALGEGARTRETEIARLKAKLGTSPLPIPGPIVAVKRPSRLPRSLLLGVPLLLGALLGASLVVLAGQGPEGSSSPPQEVLDSSGPSVESPSVGPAIEKIADREGRTVVTEAPEVISSEKVPSSAPADLESTPSASSGVTASTWGTIGPAPVGTSQAGELEPDPAALRETVEAWAIAWSEQQVDEYLGFYSDRFSPPDGLGRSKWEEQRRSRILRPSWIRVSIGSIRSTALDPGQVRASFDQAYATESYSDEVTKTLVLSWEDGVWKITGERSAETGDHPGQLANSSLTGWRTNQTTRRPG